MKTNSIPKNWGPKDPAWLIPVLLSCATTFGFLLGYAVMGLNCWGAH